MKIGKSSEQRLRDRISYALSLPLIECRMAYLPTFVDGVLIWFEKYFVVNYIKFTLKGPIVDRKNYKFLTMSDARDSYEYKETLHRYNMLFGMSNHSLSNYLRLWIME